MSGEDRGFIIFVVVLVTAFLIFAAGAIGSAAWDWPIKVETREEKFNKIDDRLDRIESQMGITHER